MEERIIVPEGAKVEFMLHGYSAPYVIKKCKANSDIEIYPNSITLIEHDLLCTDSFHPVEKQGDKYIINVWSQDALYVKDDTFFSSISDAD